MKTSTLKNLLVVATVLLALGLVIYSLNSVPTMPAPELVNKVSVVVAPAKPSPPVAKPKRKLEFPWSSDFLLFNAAGDKLAVYLIGGDTQLFDLNTGKQLWWQKTGCTCYKASLRFNEETQTLDVFDYMGGPGIAHCLSLVDGTDRKVKLYPDYHTPQVDPDLEILGKSNSLESRQPKEIIPAKVTLISSTGKLRFPSPDGSEVAETLPAPNAVCRITNASGVSYEFAIDKPSVGARYSPDGKQLAVLHDDGSVALWQRGILPMTWRKVMDLPKE